MKLIQTYKINNKMSQKESIFSRIMVGVSIILLAAALIGVLGMYKSQAINSTVIKYNSKEIQETKESLQRSIDKLETGQNTIQSDIKLILKEMK